MLRVPALLLLTGALGLFATRDDDPVAWLDGPVPAALAAPPFPVSSGVKASPSFGQFNSLAERVENLQKVSPVPVLFPAGLVDFIRAEDAASDWDKGRVMFLTERDGVSAGTTVRNYLAKAFQDMCLTWEYDPARKAIVTDFAWRRDDSRTGAQLLEVLLNTPSVAPKPFYLQLIDRYYAWTGAHTVTDWVDPHASYFWRHHQLDPDDTWRIAFDALLSLPGNLPKVWKLRFLDDQRKYFNGGFTLNLLVSLLHDDKGAPHVIVVNDEPEFMSPGEGYISYYVFDPAGKFELGGIVRSGHRCWDTKARIDSSGGVLKLRTFFNGTGEQDADFVLTRHGLKSLTPIDPGIGTGQVVYATNP